MILECYEGWSNELQFISKSLFSAYHNRTIWHHDSDSLINTGEGVDEDKAGDHTVMLIELE